ncbi:MAG TPA: tRNA epoxyqueuosine(34) reductase QueG [Nitrospiraceae bacterium]|nr:tRNA epoxyqueuosine(34) reductase QueG [Nitrospiraceae bacterium]
MSLSETIRAEARSLGFDAVGISRLSRQSDRQTTQTHDLPALFLARLRDWLSRNFHGTMAWMERDPERRADPQRVLPGCRSLISVGMNYLTNHRAHEQPGFGRIARYAWGKDYHQTLGKKLMQLEARIATLAPTAVTRSYVDTGPIMEKAWAQQAGLGWIGKHSNLVSAQFGSWLLLGEILTTLELDPDEPASDLCGSCSLCIQACPTGAIVEPYVVDANRCVSYLTIEFRGPQEAIPNDLASKMGNRIFGCDDCLDVCPFNLRGGVTREPAFTPSRVTLAPQLDELGDLQEQAFEETFRESPIRRAKQQGFARNVAIARANLSHQHQS